MTIIGKLTKAGAGWSVKEMTSGKTYTLSHVDFPPRTEGLNVRVIGVQEDSFGGGMFDEGVTLRVQKWDVV